MTPEELLKPRYKVIADYPDNSTPVGSVIVPTASNQERIEMYEMEFFQGYPHIFKKLEWWEERDEKDMPKYVRDKRDGEIFRFDYALNHSFVSGQRSIHVDNCLPATEEEYLNPTAITI